MSIASQLNEVAGFIQRKQSNRIAELLALNGKNADQTRITEKDARIDSLCFNSFKGNLEPYAEVMAAILKARKNSKQKQYGQAYEELIAGFMYVFHML